MFSPCGLCPSRAWISCGSCIWKTTQQNNVFLLSFCVVSRFTIIFILAAKQEKTFCLCLWTRDWLLLSQSFVYLTRCILLLDKSCRNQSGSWFAIFLWVRAVFASENLVYIENPVQCLCLKARLSTITRTLVPLIPFGMNRNNSYFMMTELLSNSWRQH